MPRGVHVTRILPILTKRSGPPPKTSPHGPKLYNGKRRTKTLGLKSPKPLSDLQHNPFATTWRSQVSEDVTQFIDDMEAQGTKLLPEEQKALLTNPAHYFSRPQNVPANLRDQVYFPNFSIALRRQTIYGPQYAQFEVPLWFSKLDLKVYLKQVYNVDVVHIRSYTTPARVTRKTPQNPYTQGPLYRLKSRKRMLCQLVEAFEWPVKPKDVDKTPFEPEAFWEATRKQNEETKRISDINKTLLDREHRKTIAEQAEEILAGKAAWSPTWKSLPDRSKLMEGIVEPEKRAKNPGSGSSKSSKQKKKSKTQTGSPRQNGVKTIRVA